MLTNCPFPSHCPTATACRPMFTKYNLVLRGCSRKAPRQLQATLQRLCGGHRHALTPDLTPYGMTSPSLPAA